MARNEEMEELFAEKEESKKQRENREKQRERKERKWVFSVSENEGETEGKQVGKARNFCGL